MRSAGQAWALNQLEEIIAESNGALEIVDITEPAEAGFTMRVALSVNCADYPRAEGGIPYRPRERLLLYIPAGFPLDIPSLYFAHSEYGGFPHVQWGSYICLYQSTETEWQPEDGMYGYVQRMDDWLRASAANELEPVGLPLHPPVTYQNATTPAIVPTQNTPQPTPPWWAGYAKIANEDDVCVHLGDWLQRDDVTLGMRVAPSILLPGDMPFEYPTTIAALKSVLAARGVPLEIIRLLLTIGAMRTPEGKPLIFILGAAMRGTSGGEKKQHLAAWCVDAARTTELRNAAFAATDENPLDEQLFQDWTEGARIDWCSILEDRPEIIVPRDRGTAAAFWRGKHVAILGCGAIGSAIAMLLARAGVRKLQLYDNGLVKPGLLVRQTFDRHQIGHRKADATRTNVRYINPGIDAEAHDINVLGMLRNTEQAAALFAADVVINATASIRVASALEQHLRAWPKSHPPLVSMAVGHKADTGAMTMAQQSVAGVTHDLDRRLKLEFANSANGAHFLDEFWPRRGAATKLFQPEPGCSDPTFIGSAADIGILVGRMLNVASGWLATGRKDRAYGFATQVPPAPQTAARLPLEAEYSWPCDGLYTDPRHGYQIRLAPAADAAMLAWMRQSERLRGARVETGGVLFGQIDDFQKVIWVSGASGPPPDSTASQNEFVCGTKGVAQMNQELFHRSRESVGFIGMWHTHPGGTPEPSPIDRGAMARLFASPDFKGRHFLMLIIGGSVNAPHIAGSLFDRAG